MMTIEAAADIILTTYPASGMNRPILIAIEGYGGSGKSMISELLSESLGDCQTIHMDDFILKEHLLDDDGAMSSFDRLRLKEQILHPVLKNEPLRYQRLLWVTNSLSEFIELPTSRYLIVEGISSFHPEVRDLYDYKLWIDVSMKLAKQRGQDRDGANENAQHWDLWAENDLRYQAKYHPEAVADFVIENNDARSVA